MFTELHEYLAEPHNYKIFVSIVLVFDTSEHCTKDPLPLNNKLILDKRFICIS